MSWFERIQKWYELGLWTDSMVRDAVAKGKITELQFDEITATAEKEGT